MSLQIYNDKLILELGVNKYFVYPILPIISDSDSTKLQEKIRDRENFSESAATDR